MHDGGIPVSSRTVFRESDPRNRGRVQSELTPRLTRFAQEVVGHG